MEKLIAGGEKMLSQPLPPSYSKKLLTICGPSHLSRVMEAGYYRHSGIYNHGECYPFNFMPLLSTSLNPKPKRQI